MTQATEKIARQAQKVKGKWQERKRDAPGAFEAAAPEAEAAPAAPAPRGPVRMPRIVRTTRQVVRSISLSQAAKTLDGDDDGLVVFRDGETDSLSVLYRAAGGELVLVVTEV